MEENRNQNAWDPYAKGHRTVQILCFLEIKWRRNSETSHYRILCVTTGCDRDQTTTCTDVHQRLWYEHRMTDAMGDDSWESVTLYGEGADTRLLEAINAVFSTLLFKFPQHFDDFELVEMTLNPNFERSGSESRPPWNSRPHFTRTGELLHRGPAKEIKE